ncbi:MAG TPA: LysR family transcriptional regulator, partial [Candidatus Krumholzibacteria bacterium]|nr:LysR family transcriptional regulator [Candidatus Krumholzibacteria bacterium]
RYFVSVIRTGSVGAAAEANFVTQPAVSLQLKKLETSVGQRLFVRRGRKLAPTAAGLALAARAEEIVAALDSLDAELRGLNQLEHGHLRMGNTDAASVYVLPEVYRAFHRSYPGVRIEITIGDTRHLLEELASARIELATVTLPVEGAGLTVRPIYREDLVAVAHPGHPLATKRRVRLQELAEEGIIAYPSGSTTRRMVDAVFAAHRGSVRARMEIASPEAMKRLAQAGLGVTILPRPVVATEIGRKALKVIAIEGVRFEREIGIVHRGADSLSPAGRVFLEMVEKKFGAQPRRVRERS